MPKTTKGNKTEPDKTAGKETESVQQTQPHIVLPQIAGRLFGQPLAISQSKLSVLMNVLVPRLTGDMKFDAPSTRAQMGDLQVSSGGIAIIPIHGSLVKRASSMDAMSGLVSYASIERQIQLALNAPDVTGILLDVDSHGGEVAGLLELTDMIFEARSQKPIWALANEFAFSAAYTLASAAERVFLPVTGGVGSVGVLAVHVDQSGMDEAAGLKYTSVFAGARKNDFSQHEPLSQEALEILQQRVNDVHALIVGTVARNRAMAEEAIVATQAGLFYGQDAIEQGLADEIASFSAVVGQFEDSLGTRRASVGTADDTSPGVVSMAAYREGIAREEKQKAETAAAARVKEISELCKLAGRSDLIAELTPMTVEQARKRLCEERAKEDEKTTIHSAHASIERPKAPKETTSQIYERRRNEAAAQK